MNRSTETAILWFFDRTGVVLETQQLLPKAYFTHKPICAYLPLFIALGICKNIGIRTYFGSMTVESVRVFRHFAFCSLASASFVSQKVTRFSLNPPIPLLHPNTSVSDHLKRQGGGSQTVMQQCKRALSHIN